MTESKTFVLRDLVTLTRCIHFLQLLSLAVAWKVKITLYKDPKSREQEEKYHAMIGEIAKARPKYQGVEVDAEDWKRILVDCFARYRTQLDQPLKGTGRVVPALDGIGVVQLGVQTRRFNKETASDFIEFLHMYAAHAGIKFKDQQHGK